MFATAMAAVAAILSVYWRERRLAGTNLS
jgi:hypothetical protein